MVSLNKENRIRCGRCNTEFDLSINPVGCPLCGFNRNEFFKTDANDSKTINFPARKDYLSIPPQIVALNVIKPIIDEESGKIGLWGMFNDFFSGKALLRINANMLNERGEEAICLNDLINTAKISIDSRKLSGLKGFPSKTSSDSAVNRLVYHFVVGFNKMGLFEVSLKSTQEKGKIWKADWKNILIKPTKEGLEFARLKNNILDLGMTEQVLTREESAWLINYLKRIHSEGFKEYATLLEVFNFIKKGNNGNRDLWNWFAKDKNFVEYVRYWSAKNDDPKAFEKQLFNLAQTFGTGKISLMRELGIIKNQRNDYTIIGDLK